MMTDKKEYETWRSKGSYTAIRQWSENGFEIIISDYSDPVSFSAREPLSKDDIICLYEWCKQVLESKDE